MSPKEKEAIIIGLSGGRDSVALAHFLYASERYRVILAHMNFHLRGSESDRDEAFVRELAAKRFPRATLEVKGADCTGYANEKKLSIEMAARELRYDWFEELRKAHGAGHIAVAHHADDQIETVLMNLARGTGGKGLTGMDEMDERTGVIRPFLHKTGAEIDAYIEEHGLTYIVDSTNSDETIRRNYIRHTLIPNFEKLNPSFRKSFTRSIEIFRAEQALIKDLIEKEIRERYHAPSRSILLKETDAEMPELLFRNVFAGFGFSENQIKSLKETGNRSGLKYRIPGSRTEAETFRGRLYLYDLPLAPTPYESPISLPPRTVEIPALGVVHLMSGIPYDTAHKTLRLAAKGREESLVVRNALSRDRFRPFGMKSGTKTVYDYLKEKGIPAVYRPLCPLLADKMTGEVLAVIPFEVSESARLRETSPGEATLFLSLEPLGDTASPLYHLLTRCAAQDE